MRERMKKIMGLVLVISMSVGLLAGCASTQEITLVETQEQTDISFSWWGSDPRHEYTMEAIKQFEALHPEIHVKVQYTEWTGYDKKAAIQMASGTQADVMQINFAWLNRFSADGSGYYDLEKLSDVLDLSSYTQDELNYGKSAETLNALPIALNTKVFLYNQDLFDSFGLEYPTTWEDMYQAADKMQAKGVYVLDLDLITAFMSSVAYVEQSTGKSFFDEQNKLAFSLEDVQAMLEFYMNLVDRKVVAYVGERDDNDYRNGKAAGVVQWITNVAKYETNLSDTMGQKSQVGPVPVIAGATQTGWYVKPATMYAIGSNTEHAKEAGMLLDFLVNSEEMASLQGMEKGVPVSQKAKETLKQAGEMRGIQVEAEEVMNQTDTKIMSPYYENSGLQQAFQSATNSMYYDNMPLEEAAVIAYQGMLEDLE